MTGCHAPAYAAFTGNAGSSAAPVQPNACSSESSASKGSAAVCGTTLVNVAETALSEVREVATVTYPACVRRSMSPVPKRSAKATAAAIVAWPQKGTSTLGLKYRTWIASPTDCKKAVSEYPTSRAVFCISSELAPAASSTTPAGFPPLGPSQNAVYLSTSIDMVQYLNSRFIRFHPRTARSPSSRAWDQPQVSRRPSSVRPREKPSEIRRAPRLGLTAWKKRGLSSRTSPTFGRISSDSARATTVSA